MPPRNFTVWRIKEPVELRELENIEPAHTKEKLDLKRTKTNKEKTWKSTQYLDRNC